MPAVSSDSKAPPPPAAAARWFGRLQLVALLGKSERTMAWRVWDGRSGRELALVLPRVQPADAATLERWQQRMRLASRLDHPQLAAVVEMGVQDGWPYVAYDASSAQTLTERLPARGLAASEAAAVSSQTLQGLAFAHEAGMAHEDLQPYLLLCDGGQLRLIGLGVAARASVSADSTGPAADLRHQRAAAESDVLAAGLLLHLLLTGQPPLDEPDFGLTIARLPPVAGDTAREIVRLPWTTAQPVPDPLRAIANRSTDRQQRQRYRNARTLLRALDGWQLSEGGAESGPLALLQDRLRNAGVLPSSPGAAARAARLALMERERTNELADVVLEDLALSFEMLRMVNAAQGRSARGAGGGPVLTVRRAIAMLGLDGVRRSALALRPWPGPLDEAGAAELQRLTDRCKRAGRVALVLRPAGYDAEVVYLITVLQNLGRLVVDYHFPDESAQIRRLMMSAPSPGEGEPEEPGMSEEGAAYAVLGADIEAIGAAVARQWGFDETVLSMIRRMPLATAVRSLDSDDDTLRAVASCANEAVDALALPTPRVASGLHRVVTRYGRVLAFGIRELQAALQSTVSVAGQAGVAAGSAAPTAAAAFGGPAARPAAAYPDGVPPDAETRRRDLPNGLSR